MSDVLLAISTFPDRESATRISEQLVAERLVACANIGADVESIYWWEGNVEHAGETIVFFKTTSSRFAALEKRLGALHPYDVPELVCFKVTAGLSAYLDWVRRSCAA